MPNIGDEIYGSEIGKTKRTKYVWVICKICNEERWAPRQRMQGLARSCQSCSLKNAKTFRLNPKKAIEEGRI